MGFVGDLGLYVDDNFFLIYCCLLLVLLCCLFEFDLFLLILCFVCLVCVLILCDDLCVDLGVIFMLVDVIFECFGLMCGEV